jgi:hypothetical protein
MQIEKHAADHGKGPQVAALRKEASERLKHAAEKTEKAMQEIKKETGLKGETIDKLGKSFQKAMEDSKLKIDGFNTQDIATAFADAIRRNGKFVIARR